MIRPARIEDADILTEISFASKRYWRYPEEYYCIWESELTISADYIGSKDVWVYETDHGILAYYSRVFLEKELEVGGIVIGCGHWLEHMFVLPLHIGFRIGTELFIHLCNNCSRKKIKELNILADPNARGFYEKMGCRYVKEFPSTINGRTTPHLVLSLPRLR